MKWFWNRFGGWIITFAAAMIVMITDDILKDLNMNFWRYTILIVTLFVSNLIYQVWFDHIKPEGD